MDRLLEALYGKAAVARLRPTKRVLLSDYVCDRMEQANFTIEEKLVLLMRFLQRDPVAITAVAQRLAVDIRSARYFEQKALRRLRRACRSAWSGGVLQIPKCRAASAIQKGVVLRSSLATAERERLNAYFSRPGDADAEYE